MMKRQDISLTDVLEGYAAATPAGNDNRILREWIANYPAFAAELADFAAARAIVRHLPEEDLSADEELRLRELAARRLRGAPARNSIDSLTRLAEAKGLNKPKFAAALGLSTSLLMYLEKRRLEFATIPKAIIGRISGILGTGEESVAAFLARGPEPVPQASYKAALMPEEATARSFSDAVRGDQILTPEQKKELLSLD